MLSPHSPHRSALRRNGVVQDLSSYRRGRLASPLQALMNAGRPFSASPSHPSPGGLCSVQSTGQQVRDIFCADLSELLALLIVGDSNALLLDELASNTVSVGPHTHFGAEMADWARLTG